MAELMSDDKSLSPELKEAADSVIIETRSEYLDEQSRPQAGQYVFAYTIRIENRGTNPVQLLDRHWHIIDTKDRVQEVQGVGVVGKQPTIEPEQTFQYTSGAVLESDAGTMSGSYRFRDATLGEFSKTVPTFALVRPQALH